MGRTTFDWRWIILLLIALMFFGQLRLAPSSGLGVVLLAAGGYWAIQAGLGAWRSGGATLGSTKVTYWRGQRLEIPQTRRQRFRTPAATPLIIAFVYVAMGVGLLLGALRLLLRLVGA